MEKMSICNDCELFAPRQDGRIPEKMISVIKRNDWEGYYNTTVAVYDDYVSQDQGGYLFVNQEEYQDREYEDQPICVAGQCMIGLPPAGYRMEDILR